MLFRRLLRYNKIFHQDIENVPSPQISLKTFPLLKILSPKFIKRFKGKILNIHPSLLPKYKGLNTHSRVLKSKEKYSGCTVHFVTAKLDSGKIILQKKVRIKKCDTKFTLQKRILKEEHLLYPKAISYTFKN